MSTSARKMAMAIHVAMMGASSFPIRPMQTRSEMSNQAKLKLIHPEYELIMSKDSKLPRSKRDSIVRQYNRLQSAINRGES